MLAFPLLWAQIQCCRDHMMQVRINFVVIITSNSVYDEQLVILKVNARKFNSLLLFTKKRDIVSITV